MTEPAAFSPDSETSQAADVSRHTSGEPPSGGKNISKPPLLATLLEQVRPLLLGLALLTVLTGVVFPLVLAGLAHLIFPHQANGSLIERDGVVVGSKLIGQPFAGPGYFHPRPSAAGDGYDGLASGGSNLSPTNPKLQADARRLADAYRRDNNLSDITAIPIDAVTRSGSGLDPHISPANAALQVPRVAGQRRLGEDEVRRLVADHTSRRQLGVLGEPRVNVLALNLALDRLSGR
jgi:potassium-transporting ATPase KdpC subunit